MRMFKSLNLELGCVQYSNTLSPTLYPLQSAFSSDEGVSTPALYLCNKGASTPLSTMCLVVRPNVQTFKFQVRVCPVGYNDFYNLVMQTL